MSDKKISELNSLAEANIEVGDSMVIARAGDETFKVSIDEMDKRTVNAPTKYFGDPDTDGTFRMRLDGTKLVIEKRIGGIYTLKKVFE